MRPPPFFIRTVALLLAAQISVPPDVQALRTSQPESGKPLGGLEEALKAGLEERVLVQEGSPLYARLFPLGVEPFENVLEGAFGAFFAGGHRAAPGVSDGTHVVVRKVPASVEEQGQWHDLGFADLRSQSFLLREVIDRASAPPSLEIQAGRETLVFHFNPPVALPGLPPFSSLAVAPGRVRTFSPPEFSSSFCEQVDLLRATTSPLRVPAADFLGRFLERLDTYINDDPNKSRLVILGPVGLPTPTERRNFLEVSGITPGGVWLEDEGSFQRWQQEVAAEEHRKESKRRVQEADRLFDTSRKRAELQGRLQQLLSTPMGTETLGSLLSPARVREFSQALDRMGAAGEADQALQGMGIQGRLALQYGNLQADLDRLIGVSPEPEELQPIIEVLLRAFPELSRPKNGDPTAFFRSIFQDQVMQKRGWTPARIGSLLQQVRQIGTEIHQRFPGLPWFSEVGVIQRADEKVLEGPSLLIFFPGMVQESRLMMNLFYQEWDASEVSRMLPYVLSEALADLLMFDDPALEVGGERFPKPLYPARVQQAEKGFTGHPWVQSTEKGSPERLGSLGAQTFVMGCRWPIHRFLTIRCALLIGGREALQGWQRYADLCLDEMERDLQTFPQREKKVETRLEVLFAKAVAAVDSAKFSDISGNWGSKLFTPFRQLRKRNALFESVLQQLTVEGQQQFESAKKTLGWPFDLLTILAGMDALFDVTGDTLRKGRLRRLEERVLSSAREIHGRFPLPFDWEAEYPPLKADYLQMVKGVSLRQNRLAAGAEEGSKPASAGSQVEQKTFDAMKVFLMETVQATLRDRTPAGMDRHQEAKALYQQMIQGVRFGGSAAQPHASLLTSARQTVSMADAGSQPGRSAAGKVYLASGTFSWEELLQELDGVQESPHEVFFDLGQGPLRTNLLAVRARLWNDISTWENVYSLVYEEDAQAPHRLTLHVFVAPEISVACYGPLAEVLLHGREEGDEEGDHFVTRAGTVGDLRRQIARRIADPAQREHFLAVPADEVVDMERQGRDIRGIADSTRLQPGDALFMSLAPEPSPGADPSELAGALYQVPALYQRYLAGSTPLQGPLPSSSWSSFLAAVQRENPKAYESLKRLPVPERYFIHGDLVSNGSGVLITGDAGAGKSLLAALLTRNFGMGYLVNDVVMVLKFQDRLVAGIPVSRKQRRLTTRYRLKGARATGRTDQDGKAIYTIPIKEIQRFVPLAGILWLNRQPSEKGRRDLPTLLGLTEPADIERVWSASFQEGMLSLPVQEYLIGSTAGLPRFQQVARAAAQWAQQFWPQASPAGMEEILLQPGTADYDRIFREGLTPSKIVAGPLLQFLRKVSQSRPVRIRVVGNETEWKKLGFRSLLFSEQLAARLFERLAWPRAGLSISHREEGGVVVGEEIRFSMNPPLRLGDWVDPIEVREVGLVPEGFATFSLAGIQPKLEEREPFADQMRTLLKTNRVRLVGGPLGLPSDQDKENFVQAVLHLGRTGVPLRKVLQSEQRARERRQQQEEETRRRTISEITKAVDSRVASLLTQVQQEINAAEGDWFPYVDSGRVTEIQDAARELPASVIVRKQIQISGDLSDLENRSVQEFQRRLGRLHAQMEGLPGERLSGQELERALARVLEEFTELAPKPGVDRVHYYYDLLNRRDVYELGWTPARMVQLLRRVRWWKEIVDRRLPGAPWFSSVVAMADPSAPGPITLSDVRGSGRLTDLQFDLRGDLNRVLERSQLSIPELWARLLFPPTPQEVSRGIGSPRPFFSCMAGCRGDWMTMNPIPAVQLMPTVHLNDLLLNVFWMGGERATQGTRWTLFDAVGVRIALWVGGDLFAGEVLRDIGRILTKLQKMREELEPLEQLTGRLVNEMAVLCGGSVTPQNPRWQEKMSDFERVYHPLYPVPPWGNGKELYLFSQRRDLEIGALVSLTAIRSVLQFMPDPEQAARADSLADWMAEDLRQMERSPYAPPHRFLGAEWEKVYPKMVGAYTTFLEGIRIPRLQAGGLEDLMTHLPRAGQERQEQAVPLRFLVDTKKEDARLLRWVQLAVRLSLRWGYRINVAGVSTQAEREAAKRQLPLETQDLFESLVQVYSPEDEEGYRAARAIAEGMIEGFHPELEITTVRDPATVRWFLGELQRLGLSEFSAGQEEQTHLFLESA